jgi:hypothetical protein
LSEIAVETKPLLLDLGCGKNPREGFTGVDAIDFGQGVVLNLVELMPKGSLCVTDNGVSAAIPLTKYRPWPWEDNSVTEVHCSHFVEHLKPHERIHFANELHRVLIPGGKATIIVPHYASERSYGDLTHEWPPVVGFWFSYLDKLWRSVQAPHNTEYTCDFHATWGFSMHPQIATHNQEYQMHALTFWREAAQDMIATLVKK